MLANQCEHGMKKIKAYGFISLIGLWLALTMLCYCKTIVFDNTTLSGSMISGLVLSTSVLGIVRLLRVLYETTYSAIVEERREISKAQPC